MYGIELAFVTGKAYTAARKDLLRKVRAIADVANIPEINVQKGFLELLLQTDCLNNAGIGEFEHIRAVLRELIKYIPLSERTFVDIDLQDEILSSDWEESELDSDDLKNYKLKVSYYIRHHQDAPAIAKLKSNQPLGGADVKELEKILWSEVGTKQDYEREYGSNMDVHIIDVKAVVDSAASYFYNSEGFSY